MDTYNWNLTEGMVIKSLYGNTFFENPVEYLDCKINEWINLEQIEMMVKDRFCFSFGDKGLNMHLKYFLNKNFLDPSKYEWVYIFAIGLFSGILLAWFKSWLKEFLEKMDEYDPWNQY